MTTPSFNEPPLAGSDLGPAGAESASRLDAAIDAARAHLLGLQRGDGHWCAELEGDTILESEYLLLLYYLAHRSSGGEERSPFDEAKFQRGCAYIRGRQLPEGGWATYPGGAADVSQSVKAYFVLKLAGDAPEAEHMQRAREAIVAGGGLEAVNSYTKIYLAIFGQTSWDEAPAVPPELILLPRWFYVNIYAMSSWSRAIVVPLGIVWACKPKCPVASELGLDELRTGAAPPSPHRGASARFWARFFTAVDQCIKAAERWGLLRPFRKRALDRSSQWVAERLRASDGLGAIFPPIINTVIAFSEQGHGPDSPLVASQLRELEKLELRHGDELRLQPCFSPVWDTALCLNALLDAGADPASPEIQRGVAWLLEREVREKGDWQVALPDTPPGGWYFEYANEFYPDCDDTAEVLSLLARVELHDERLEARRVGAVGRGLAWQRAMQNRDGGWGAFDRECNRKVLEFIPFADHNAMIDPSTVDITSRSIEALVAHGGTIASADVQRAIEFVLREQEDDGAWYGRWGVNYIYGTWLALGALHTAAPWRDPKCVAAAQRGAAWLRSVQNEDGGWGESADSYLDPSLRGRGPSTAAQTGWAILGLLAVRRAVAGPLGGWLNEEEVQAIDRALGRGVDFLLEQQEPSGVWDDTYWTGTGFPTVFYLKYHYYDHYFPLQALATYREHLAEASPAAAGERVLGRPS